VKKPIILYNIPSTTHIDLTPEIVIKLAEIKNIIGIKESIDDINKVKNVINGIRKKTFSTFAGWSLRLLETLKIGGAGCICPLVNTYPELIVGIYDAFKDGDKWRSEEMHKKLMELEQIIRIPELPYIAATKEIMKAMGIPIKSIVKKPLPQLSEVQRKIIWANIEKVGLLNTALT
jgi:4-hydroxy-tetrahydrodipicolinate synthase